jgi:hypothetical protein
VIAVVVEPLKLKFAALGDLTQGRPVVHTDALRIRLQRNRTIKRARIDMNVPEFAREQMRHSAFTATRRPVNGNNELFHLDSASRCSKKLG